MIAGGATRRSIVVGIGGGVIGNLTGLTASLLYRGIRFAHVPTTVMAMHDSVTSLKQGVNCGEAKNILGLFSTPSAVFIDLKFLESLPPPHISAGLAELLKNGLVLGGQYLSSIVNYLQSPHGDTQQAQWAELIQLGIAAKLSVMQNDPHERGPAMIMEYGHTIGHAIELASGGEINHGQSIAWGMRCAGWIAHELGHMSNVTLQEYERLLDLLGTLPRPALGFDRAELWRRVQLDNKRGYLPASNDDSIAMVLLHKPGAVVHQDQPFPLTLVRGEVVRGALDNLAKLAI
jgi:3-dehydroquinate synthase/2-deoxy-scyllo-inosose synthase